MTLQDSSEEIRPGRRVRIRHHTATGGVWFAGWLFTAGFVHLGFWQTALALIIWPYYLGANLSRLIH